MTTNSTDGQSLLMYAALTEDFSAVRSSNSGFDDTDDEGRSVLMYAATGGNLDIVQWLVQEKGADINHIDDYGRNPLISAGMGGDVETTKWLVYNGANIELVNNEHTVFDMAALWGHRNLIEWMLSEKEYFPPSITIHGLYSAICSKETELAQWIIMNHLNVCGGHLKGTSPFILSICEHNMKIVETMLQQGVAHMNDIDVRNGENVWDLVRRRIPCTTEKQKIELFRVLVLFGPVPNNIIRRLSPRLKKVVTSGKRLRRRLPVYSQKRNEKIRDGTSILVSDIHNIISSYDEMTTVKEKWSTGLHRKRRLRLKKGSE
jgi:hypothetical protein